MIRVLGRTRKELARGKKRTLNHESFDLDS